ncbi:MAG: PTS sugar transporter subunit IIA [Candidatus Hydrogenedentota bacterium]|mgnify:CR=1 FL=1
MLLKDIVNESTVTASLAATEKYAAITELIDLAIKAGSLGATLREHAIDAVFSRERSMSTGMEHGVALPHASSNRIKKSVCALGISREGIDFECVDGKPARIVVLVISPKRKIQQHVHTLAGISQLLHDDAFRESLVSASDEAALLARIRGEEAESFFGRLKRKLS